MSERALIVSGSEGEASALCALLEQMGYAASAAGSAAEARRRLCEESFAAVVISALPGGGFGAELAREAVRTTDAGVLLIARQKLAGSLAESLEGDGVFVLERPVPRPLFQKAVRLAGAARRRLQTLRNENAQLQNKIEEIRLIDRAKCVLMQVLILTEPQAHRYIEKQAMDLRCTKKQIAEDILRTYEM